MFNYLGINGHQNPSTLRWFRLQYNQQFHNPNFRYNLLIIIMFHTQRNEKVPVRWIRVKYISEYTVDPLQMLGQCL